MESSPGPASFDSLASGAIPREAIHQEGVLVHIPESAVTDHGGEAIVESNTTRDEGRPRAIAEDGYPVFINIVPRREVIHHVADRGFQVGTTHHLVEFGAGAGTEEIHSQQRHSPLARVTCHLEEVFFFPVSGIAHAHDDRRSARSGQGRQKIAFQRVAFQPGNLDHLAGRRQMRDVAAGAVSHGPERVLPLLVGSIQCER